MSNRIYAYSACSMVFGMLCSLNKMMKLQVTFPFREILTNLFIFEYYKTQYRLNFLF